MPNPNVGEPDTYTMLTTCMARGAHVELTLRGGETVGRFRTHDIIAPQGLQIRPDMSGALVRGIVSPDHGERRDRAIKLRDIEEVRDEHLALPYFADAGFSRRHSVPARWARLAICPSGPKAQEKS